MRRWTLRTFRRMVQGEGRKRSGTVGLMFLRNPQWRLMGLTKRGIWGGVRTTQLLHLGTLHLPPHHQTPGRTAQGGRTEGPCPGVIGGTATLTTWRPWLATLSPPLWMRMTPLTLAP